mmetsp:Transcript_14676/g.28069  ORF Transcript_14676/g.28069 Transcript_14676/m.28069 type:complete len:220 (+) Transcript_14676:1217-1876(+)
MHRDAQSLSVSSSPFSTSGLNLAKAAEHVLTLSTAASKLFLITIGDRSVTSTVTRDQFVGPWQVPVADVAVTSAPSGVHTLCLMVTRATFPPTWRAPLLMAHPRMSSSFLSTWAGRARSSRSTAGDVSPFTTPARAAHLRTSFGSSSGREGATCSGAQQLRLPSSRAPRVRDRRTQKHRPAPHQLRKERHNGDCRRMRLASHPVRVQARHEPRNIREGH